MPESLLRTKLFVPPLSTNLVPRPRLVEKINEGVKRGHLLTLVSAPAGFGKTNLVTEWLHLRSAAWLSLDESDNDPVRFLAYLIAALRETDEGIGGTALSLLESEQIPALDTVMTALINELTAVSGKIVLVLDDYHLIQAQSIHSLLAFLLGNQPKQLHLVIITRADPLLPLARIRARGQLSEIRETDLRFNLEEAWMFFNKIMRLELTLEEVETLDTRTEGWIAGLQMAAQTIQNVEDVPGFIRSFSGSHRYVLDFLTDEVLSHRPSGTRDFLLQTSILDRLCGPLCEAVTGQSGGQVALEGLEKAGLFIIPLDQSRQWYRYHRLFRELLLYRLRVLGDPAEELLRQRASQWFKENGFQAEAISQALAAEIWDTAAKLIEQASDDMLKKGQTATLIDWCQKLPPATLRSHPDLGLSFSWSLLLAGRFDDAGNLLDDLEGFTEEPPTFQGQLATAQAYLARARGDHNQVIEKSKTALANLPESELVSRGTVALNLGLVYWHTGRLQEAEPVLQEARVMAERISNHYGRVAARIFLSRTFASRGLLRQAEALIQEIVSEEVQVPILALAHFDLAALHYEWNELEQAGEQVRRGLELIRPSGNVEFQYAGHILQATLFAANKDAEGAWRELGTAARLSENLNAAAQSRIAACHVQIALVFGELETAVHWSKQLFENVDAHPFYRFLGLTRPRLLLAQNQREAAAGQLEICYETASRSGWGYGVVATRVWQSIAAATAEQALSFLGDAMRIAQPEGYVRTFTDADEALKPLLQMAAVQGIYPSYARQILASMTGKEMAGIDAVIDRTVRGDHSALIEPLSERELEILQLLIDRRTNAEIALALSVSVNTVKTHLQHIYQKLGVHSRRTAAARARELNLL